MGTFKLDWEHWVYGLAAAMIGGGAGSIGSGLSAMGLAPGQFNLSTVNGEWSTLKLMFGTFLIGGIITAAAYLAKSPLPAIEETTKKTVSHTIQDGEPEKVVSTVTETRTETK